MTGVGNAINTHKSPATKADGREGEDPQKMSLFVPDDDAEEELVLNLNSVPDDDAPQQQQHVPHVEEYPLIPTEDPDLVDHVEPIDISLTLPLRFQHIVLEDLIAGDSLLILGKGLGLEPIVANLLHALSAPATFANVKKRSLVIVLGASVEDNAKISDELMELSWIEKDGPEEDERRPFVVIRSESYTPEKRKSLYLKGGIMSVTSRIFIYDMLSGTTINPAMITGLVILHADRITELSNESFIASMYRQKNSWGFIKALSDAPEAFAQGFAPLSKKLKDLRLKKVLLWPRFHIDVSKSLVNKDTKSVTEVKVAMTESMKHIQIGLMACLQKCIEELKRKNPQLATEYWSIENALDDNFTQSIHTVLNPQWHRISHDSKQLTEDIRLLKYLLKSLISYDCVDFYEVIKHVMEANKPTIDKKDHFESPWLMAEESQAVIKFARKRVHDKTPDGKLLLEEAPKWEQLALLLDDIVAERAHDSTKTGPVLIMCSDRKVKALLKRFISSMEENKDEPRSFSARMLMLTRYHQHSSEKEITSEATNNIKEANTMSEEQTLNISRAFAKGPVTSKRRRTRGGAAVAAVSRLHNLTVDGEFIESEFAAEEVDMELMELEAQVDNDDHDAEESIILEISNLETDRDPSRHYQYINRENQVIVEQYSGKTDDILLHEHMPSFIVMYEPDLDFIRRVEVYQAIHKESPARTFFMYYSDSIEEQRHLMSIKKEKDAFTKLIREKAKLASHFESEEDFNKYHTRKKSVINTRVAGGQFVEKTESQIVVDIREFGAPLPGFLYRIGLKVIPCQLTVGDYILTPKVCVERKSIGDLIGSFKSGRLYEQCARMSKYYELPTLLIEFDNNQSFSLEPFSETRGGRALSVKAQHPHQSAMLQGDIQKNLAALVINFPRLRILWSSSPRQTAELMVELKEGREEPVIVDAVNAGLKEDKKRNNTLLTNNIAELLKEVPGVTKFDCYNIMKKVNGVQKLIDMSRNEVAALVGSDLGDAIYDYLTENYK